MAVLRRWFRRGGSGRGRRRRGGFSRAIRTEWRGNAVAVPLLAVRAAAQGDVILRGSGELKCRVTKGRTVQRQAARSRHTGNARLQPSKAASWAILCSLPPRPGVSCNGFRRAQVCRAANVARKSRSKRVANAHTHTRHTLESGFSPRT